MPAKILVVGRSGQLAQELALSNAAGLQIDPRGRDQFNMNDTAAIAATLKDNAPDAVINASAYTAVDKAETEQELAMALNRDAPAALAIACADMDIPFLHVSTDYVFDGAKSAPYVETDAKSPTSVYGKSKSLGEDLVLEAGGHPTILRTSWVFSAHGTNFLLTMLRLAQSRDELGVVADQLGRPTWARDLANGCITAVQRGLDRDQASTGVFHYSNTEDATWADFAQHIFENAARIGLPAASVNRITSAEFPTPVKRPANSRLDTSKFESTFGVAIQDWRSACKACMQELA